MALPNTNSGAQAAAAPSAPIQGGSVDNTVNMASQSAPQQQQDPTLPTSNIPGNEQLARYRQRRDALVTQATQEAQTRDPFAMNIGGAVSDAQKQQTQKDVWLASTPVAMAPIPTFNQHEHDNFMEHYNNDPAVKELEERGVWNVVDTMAEMVKRGDMTMQDALGQLQSDGFTGIIDETIQRHHSDNPHSMLDHPMKTGRGNPNRPKLPINNGGK